MNGAWSIFFAPLLPWLVIAIGGSAMAAAIGYGFYSGARRGLLCRLWAAALLLFYLCGPQLAEQKRAHLPSSLLLVLDKSASMSLARRDASRDAAEASIRKAIKSLGGNLQITPVVVTGDDETDLFGAITQASSAIPADQRAGAVILTDGEVHDVPADLSRLMDMGPVHSLIIGRPDLPDRKLTLITAPAYGLVGQSVEISARVDSATEKQGTPLQLTITDDDGQSHRINAAIGRPVDIPVTIPHEGDNHIKIDAEPLPDELTLRNNTAVAAIKGVRDRLRVLLVSGAPHMGLRAWRDLLKADPSIDVVHFTILRTMFKRDPTPMNEMALIEFPVRELFEQKLSQFDLVIFDRFASNALVPNSYLENIARYVRNGGALLEAGGALAHGMEKPDGQSDPENIFMKAQSHDLFDSPVAAILPAMPDGGVRRGDFRPQISDTGLRHPVTRDFQALSKNWGRWQLIAPMKAISGDVVMEGPDGLPLLILAREGKGRVAEMASDQMWLWARGYDGGGPQAALTNRIVHWLLKAPELEAESLNARNIDGRLEITHQTLSSQSAGIELAGPDGKVNIVEMPQPVMGISRLTTGLLPPGLYHLKSGASTASVMVGPSDLAPEWQDVQATDKILRPFSEATGGATAWIKSGTDIPSFYLSGPARHYRDGNRMGLRAGNAYHVIGGASAPLIPAPLALLTAALLMILAWRREAK